MDNISKIVLVVLVLALLYVLWKRSKRSTVTKSPYVPFDEMPFDAVPAPGSTPNPSVTTQSNPPMNVASDLLPKPTSPQVLDFGEFAPKALQGQNFLDVSQQIGVDTQGSSLKNANYQLRSDPPNPRTNVGPWANSTIDTDLLRRPLE